MTLMGTDDRCASPWRSAPIGLPRNSRHTLGYNGPGLPEWRTSWAALLDACIRIVAFSKASVEILRKAYLALRPEVIELRQHSVDLGCFKLQEKINVTNVLYWIISDIYTNYEEEFIVIDIEKLSK